MRVCVPSPSLLWSLACDARKARPSSSTSCRCLASMMLEYLFLEVDGVRCSILSGGVFWGVLSPLVGGERSVWRSCVPGMSILPLLYSCEVSSGLDLLPNASMLSRDSGILLVDVTWLESDVTGLLAVFKWPLLADRCLSSSSSLCFSASSCCFLARMSLWFSNLVPWMAFSLFLSCWEVGSCGYEVH